MLLNDRTLRVTKEAVRNVFWTREELRRLFKRAQVPDALVSEVHPDTKTWASVDIILDALNKNDAYHPILEKVVEETLQYRNGSHLKWAGGDRVEAADESLKKLRDEVGELAEDRRRKTREQQERNERLEKSTHGRLFSQKLAELNERFLAWFGSSDHNARGYDFEAILSELFDLFDLAPKSSFRRKGEQIDGAFRLDNENYLLEAKWEAKLVDLNGLRDLDGAVSSTIETTLGLFVSVNGFSPDALASLIAGNRPRLICMDGSDLAMVLDGRIDLCMLLRRKKEIAAQRRIVFAKAEDIMSGKY